MSMFIGEPPRPKQRAKVKRRTHRLSKRRRVWRRVQIAARFVFFVAIYLVWPLLKRWLSPSIIFAVYGTIKDRRAYFSPWVDHHLRRVFPIGLIRFGREWGLIGATKIPAEGFNKDPQLALRYVEDIRREFPRAKVIALAGRLPGWIRRAGGEIAPPFVDGSLGTRYAMLSAARNCCAKLGKSTQRTVLALLGGAGYTGSQVVRDTAQEFGQVIALDPRFEGRQKREGNVLQTGDPINLSFAQAAVVLTASGDDIRDIVPFFAPGTVLADDTHPPIHRQIREKLGSQEVDVWKAVMKDGYLIMIPRLPNFRRDNIPGCLLEALVVLLSGREVLDSQRRFNEAADRLGFRAQLIRHPDDS